MTGELVLAADGDVRARGNGDRARDVLPEHKPERAAGVEELVYLLNAVHIYGELAVVFLKPRATTIVPNRRGGVQSEGAVCTYGAYIINVVSYTQRSAIGAGSGGRDGAAFYVEIVSYINAVFFARGNYAAAID